MTLASIAATTFSTSTGWGDGYPNCPELELQIDVSNQEEEEESDQVDSTYIILIILRRRINNDITPSLLATTPIPFPIPTTHLPAML